MKGFVIADAGHVVNALPPVDMTGGKSTDRMSMKLHHHVTFILQIGVSAAAVTSIVVNAADAASSGNSEAIPFSYYSEETALGDTLGARTVAASTGITSPTANDNTFYVIEIDAAELPEDKPWVYITIANGANSVIGSCIAILSGSRYGHTENETVIA